MGDQLTGSPSSKDDSDNPYWMSTKFDELCPEYMSFGMSPEEYWHGDPEWVTFYAKAQKRKRQQANTDAWLIGSYVLAAINHCFGKGSDAQYPSEPFPITLEEQERRDARERARNMTRLQNELFGGRFSPTEPEVALGEP